MSLSSIQTQLHAPKNQNNAFGGYKYRSCEDIVEAIKPLLNKYDARLVISDDIVQVGDRVYVKATATITFGSGETASATAYAREPLERKGMDLAQVTGATSSYARKYALNGLLAIDDTKDADATNTHEDAPSAPVSTAKIKRLRTLIKETSSDQDKFLKYLGADSLASMTMSQYDKGLAMLEAKKAKAAANA